MDYSAWLYHGPTRLLCPWDSPGKNTGVGCHFLLQGIFPTQGSNPGIKPWSPALEADTFTSEPPGKPFTKEQTQGCQSRRESKEDLPTWFLKIEDRLHSDVRYPAGFMDVIDIDKSGGNFHLICDPNCSSNWVWGGHIQVLWNKEDLFEYLLNWFAARPNRLVFHQVWLVCVCWQEVVIWDKLTASPVYTRTNLHTRRERTWFACLMYGKLTAVVLPQAFPTYSSLEKEQTMNLSVPKKEHLPHHGWRRRLLAKQSNGWNDFQSREVESFLWLIKDVVA